MQSIQELVAALRAHPDVVGLIEYGSARADDGVDEGDYDCCVFVTWSDVPIESLHFVVDGTPVDLNLRSLTQLRARSEQHDFDASVLRGPVTYDPTGEVRSIIDGLDLVERATPPSPHQLARLRHGHRHTFDKIRGRMAEWPLLCRILLTRAVADLVQHYFWVRHQPWLGEKGALRHLEEHRPELHDALMRYYATDDLQTQFEQVKALAEWVLEPVGGLWREDEVLAFGEDAGPDLQERARAIYERLFV